MSDALVHNYGRAPHVSTPPDRPGCPACPACSRCKGSGRSGHGIGLDARCAHCRGSGREPQPEIEAYDRQQRFLAAVMARLPEGETYSYASPEADMWDGSMEMLAEAAYRQGLADAAVTLRAQALAKLTEAARDGYLSACNTVIDMRDEPLASSLPIVERMREQFGEPARLTHHRDGVVDVTEWVKRTMLDDENEMTSSITVDDYRTILPVTRECFERVLIEAGYAPQEGTTMIQPHPYVPPERLPGDVCQHPTPLGVCGERKDAKVHRQ